MKFPKKYFEDLLLRVSHEEEWRKTINIIMLNFDSMNWLNMITIVNSRHSIDYCLIFDQYYHDLYPKSKNMKNNTQSNKPNRCKFCTKRFINSDGVLKHVKKAHHARLDSVIKGKKSTYMI